MLATISRRGTALRLALSLGTILGTGLATPAVAQLAPPAAVRQSVDGNGVDLFGGTLAIDGPALTVGAGDPKGMSYYKMYRGQGWTDNLIAVMNISGNDVTVTFGATSDRFTKSGTSYISTEGGGTSLTLGGTVYTYTTSDGTVAHFSTSRAGVYPQYANAGRVTDITAPSGETLSFGYDSVSYCSSTKPSSTGTICLSHSTAYRLAQVDNRYGYRASFTYDDSGLNPQDDEGFDLAAWSTSVGITLTNRATGASVSGDGFSNAAGQHAQYRTSGAQIVGITRPGSTAENVTIGYAGQRVSSVTTAAGTTGYAASDAGGTRNVTVTAPDGQATAYTFDIALARMRSMTDPLGRTTLWDYDAYGRVTRVTRPEQDYTQVGYDARGNVIEQRRVAKPGSGLADLVTSAAYPASCTGAAACNQPVTTTDARGGVTDYAYDPTHGAVTSVTAPAGADGVRPQTRYGYTAITDTVTGASVWQPTGVSTCRTGASCAGTADETRTTILYETGNLLPVGTTVAAGDGSLSAGVSMSYDGIGNVTAVDGPLPGTGDTMRYGYDTLRRVTTAVGPDPDGGGPRLSQMVQVTYDAQGRAVSQSVGTSDAAGNGFVAAQTLTTTYDAVDRKTAETLGAGGAVNGVQQYGYDAGGRLECAAVRMNAGAWGALPASACTLQAAGAAGEDRVARTTYDAAGQVTGVTSGYGTSVAASEARGYTTNGQLAWASDANGNRTSYGYDGFDRLSRTSYPVATLGANASNAGDYEQLGYDAGGQVTSRRLRDGRSIGVAYDALGRVTVKDIPGGTAEDVYYAYDLQGRLLSARFGSAAGEGIVNGYDALGRTSITTNTMGGVSRSLGYEYDAGGNRTRITHGDGTRFDYGRDALGRMTSASWWTAATGTVPFFGIAYDDLGRRTSTGRASSSTGYGYDAASRLAGLTQNFAGGAGNASATFGYNPAGQIASRAQSNGDYAFAGGYTVNRSYATNGLNQYGSAGLATFTYDANGNLTGDGSHTYGYDAENRLVSSGSVTLKYDPLGRLWQTAGGGYGNTQFVYDGDALVAEYDGDTGGMRRRYFHGPGTDEPVLWDEGSAMDCSGTKVLHGDERGSIVAVADCFGNRVAANTYDDYGIPGSGNFTSALRQRFQYTGQAWIPELGMYYYKARMYSPTLGRFLQTDPIGYGDGMNWYNYVGGDPVNNVDPTGLQTTTPIRPCPQGMVCDSSGNPICGVGSGPDCKPGPDIPVNGERCLATAGCFTSIDDTGKTFITLPGREPFEVTPGDIVVVASKSQKTNSKKPGYCNSPIRNLGAGLENLSKAGKVSGASVAAAGGIGIATVVFAPEGAIAVAVGTGTYLLSELVGIGGSLLKAATGDYSGAPGLSQYLIGETAELSRRGSLITGVASDLLIPSGKDPCK